MLTPKLKEYLCWEKFDDGDEGEYIVAYSASEARKEYARVYGLSTLDVASYPQDKNEGVWA